ncbi:MAG: heavy-metal-associated domain-containing protein [Cytophagales bacterium]|nr:heavy-metal-associated domain-containing protein [Cytophagales bacterium]
MKTILTIAILGLAIMVQAQIKPEKVKGGYKVEIKTSAICEMCKETIEHDLTFEKGVKSVDLDVDSKIATVVYNTKKTSAELIRKRITRVGYNADNLKRDVKAYDKLDDCCKDGAHGDDDHDEHKN